MKFERNRSVKMSTKCKLCLCYFTDLPPPPPEAFDAPDDDSGKHNIQSRTFKVLQDAVDHGGLVFFFFFCSCHFTLGY